MKKLFIVGCVRSGTTLLQQVLNRHPEVVIPPETGFFNRLLGHTLAAQRHQLRQINADLKIDLPLPRGRVRGGVETVALYEHLASRYAGRVGTTEATYFGEKTPQHLFYLSRIKRLFPEAKVLLLYRDGRDVASSMTKVPWCPKDLDINFAFWLRCYRCQVGLEGGADPNLLGVRYEDLVRHPEVEVRRITDFLGLAYESRTVEGQGNQEGIAPWEHGWKARSSEKITASRVESWRTELTAGQISRLERWGGPALRALGYPLVSHPVGGPPWNFFLRLWGKQSLWRVRVAWEMARREALGR